MSLNFNYANVTNKDEVTTSPFDPESHHPVLDAIVLLSMVCGYNEITEDNAPLVAKRIAQYELINGSYLRLVEDGKPVPVYITLVDVLTYVGLRMNTTKMTDAQWNKSMLRMLNDKDNYGRIVRKQLLSAYEQCAHVASKKETEAA